MKKLIIVTALATMSMATSAIAGTGLVKCDNDSIFKTSIIEVKGSYNNFCDIIKPTEVTTKICFESTTQSKPEVTTENTTQSVKPTYTTEATTESTTQSVKPTYTTEATTESTTQSVKPTYTTEATTESTTQSVKPTYTTEATTESTTQSVKPTYTTEATTESTTQSVKPTYTTEATTESTTQKVTETSTETTTASANVNSSTAKELLNLVNKARAENGLSALTLNSNLSAVAQKKAEDMKNNNYFSHTSPTYGSPFDMIKNAGINYKTAGENIAKGQKTAEAVFNAWMNSSGHRANILNSRFTQMGIGVTDGSNKYWSQMFIG